MVSEKYVDSDEYQCEIAGQFKKRLVQIPAAKVGKLLNTLGIFGVDISLINEAAAGNMNATYLTPDLAIKINPNKEKTCYLADKIIFDILGKAWPIAEVLAYDFFGKTDCEILVMKRAKGALLLDDIFDLGQNDLIGLFREVLAVVKRFFDIKFSDHGFINGSPDRFMRYSDFLIDRFKSNVKTIESQGLCGSNDIKKIKDYFLRYVSIFDEGEAVFVHADVQMGNIIHNGDKLAALIDCDYSMKAPKIRALVPLLGFIAEPSQFVEGTKEFAKFNKKSFYYLLPVLKQELPELFVDPQLLRKLNIIGIGEGMMWVSQNWSKDWNHELIADIINREIAEKDEDLQKSYYGKILARLDG